MPIFNTATLDGHDVVMTPLPKEYCTSSDFGIEARNLKEKNLCTMFDLLVTKYGNGIAVTQIDLDPEKMNIHTTWAFDPGTREELKGIIEDQWSKRNKSLIDKWKYLCERARSGAPQDFEIPSGLQLIDRERPPKD